MVHFPKRTHGSIYINARAMLNEGVFMKPFLDLEFIAVKTTVAVVVLFIFARIMGKKQISQLTYFDYIVGISIGSVAAELSVEKGVSIPEGIVSMIIWAAFPLILSFIAAKSMRARRLLDGTPTILIQNGKIIEKNLQKVKFTVNDLLEELRIQGAFNIADVEFALLETGGKMSVLKKAKYQTATVSDLNLKETYQGLCANLIIDGKLMHQNIALLDKGEEWVISELKKRNISSVADVLLACVDSNGEFHIDLKNQNPIVYNVLH